MNINFSKYTTTATLSPAVQELLHKVGNDAARHLIEGAAAVTNHNGRKTIMSSDLIRGAEYEKPRGVGAMDFNAFLTDVLGEQHSFKFAKNVKQIMRGHTDQVFGELVSSLESKDEPAQLQQLHRGISLHEVLPLDSLKEFNFKPAASAIQKTVSSDYMTSDAAKTYLQLCAVRLSNLLAKHAGSISVKKTISEKDVEVVVLRLLPKHVSDKAVAFAKATMERYASDAAQKGMSRRNRAGLETSVTQMTNVLRHQNSSTRVSENVPVYLAAIVESVVAHLITGAQPSMMHAKKKTITPVFINLGIKTSAEMNNIFMPCMGAA